MEDSEVREKYIGKKVRCVDPSWAILLEYDDVYEVIDAFLLGTSVYYVLKGVNYQGVRATRFEDADFDGVDHYGRAYRQAYWDSLVKEAQEQEQYWGNEERWGRRRI